MFFMGTYTPKLDEKGRLFLPAKFRDRLAEGLVVTKGRRTASTSSHPPTSSSVTEPRPGGADDRQAQRA